jgi:hypothetical protein
MTLGGKLLKIILLDADQELGGGYGDEIASALTNLNAALL